MEDRKQGAGLSSGSSAAVHKANSEEKKTDLFFLRIASLHHIILAL